MIKAICIAIVVAFLLSGCGPSEQDAKQAGFSSVAEMKEMKSKGFNSKDEYAKSLGFADSAEMAEAAKLNFGNKKDYDNYLEKKRNEEEAQKIKEESSSLTSESPMDIGVAIEKLIVSNPKAQQAALKVMDVNTFGICGALTNIIVVNQIKYNTQFEKGIVVGVGMAFGASAYYRKYMMAKGTPDAYFGNSIKMYSNQSLVDQTAYFQKYSGYCVQKGVEFSALAN